MKLTTRFLILVIISIFCFTLFVPQAKAWGPSDIFEPIVKAIGSLTGEIMKELLKPFKTVHSVNLTIITTQDKIQAIAQAIYPDETDPNKIRYVWRVKWDGNDVNANLFLVGEDLEFKADGSTGNKCEKSEWVKKYFGTALYDGNADSDGDGLKNDVEYSCGSNPLSIDSDEDGIKDKRDLSGYGGNGLNFNISPAFSGRKINICAQTYGEAHNKECDRKDCRAPDPDDAAKFKCKTVSFAEHTLKVFLTSDPKLAQLSNVCNCPLPGDIPCSLDDCEDATNGSIKVEARVSEAETSSQVYFKWYLDGQKMTTDALHRNVEGNGKDTFYFDANIKWDGTKWTRDAQGGDVHTITCDVEDQKTGRTGSEEIEVPVGVRVELTGSLRGNRNADQTKDPWAFCLPDGTYPANPAYPGDVSDKVNQEINEKGYVRKDDIIQVEASSELPSFDKDDYIFNWFLDGKQISEASGRGENIFVFPVTKPPSGEHDVKVSLLKASDFSEFGWGERDFIVQDYYVKDFEITGDVTKESGEGGTVVYYVKPLGEVNLSAVAKYCQPTYAPSFHYIWKLNGEVAQTGVDCGGEMKPAGGPYKYCETTTSNISTFAYQAGETGDVTDTITLTVENYIGADDIADEIATQSIDIIVKSTGAREARGPVTRLFAQAGGAISSYFKNIFNIVLSLGIIGFIVFVVMAAGEVRRRR